ncbi:fungal specific transcription factor domain-containing protein [Fusarium avenaceum]|nr:fungal specific transcription factor domain-containing protein [Fusarium avenaceum]
MDDDSGQLEANRLGTGNEWPSTTPTSIGRAVSAILPCLSASWHGVDFQQSAMLVVRASERKIDLIDNRLQKAIGLLEKLQAGESSSESSKRYRSPQTSAQTSHSISTPASDSTQPKRAYDQVVEGGSSLTAHSAFANEFLQQVAATSCLRDSSPELSNTIDELSSILVQDDTAGDELAYPHARPIQQPTLPANEMPPFKKAIALIRLAQANAVVDAVAKTLVGIGWIYEFLPFQRFTDMCLDVYFNDNHSEASFITVNAGLYSLFCDYSLRVDTSEREQYITYAHLCRDNLETVLSNLPLHLPANSDMILALLFGAFYAIELSKPSLSWTLSAKGSELCQTLGFHRDVSIQKDKREDFRYKQFLFWSIYFIDKSLSLRLGRPSTIPDWDITVPRPSADTFNSEPALAYFVVSVETARCQGNIYEMLYSPKSMAEPDEIKGSRIEAVLSDLRDLETMIRETNEKWFKEAKESSGEEIVNFFYMSDIVLRLSLLTLVHRAAPRLPGAITTFNHDCVVAARATLEKHEECIALVNRSRTSYLATYMHWTLLFAPFVPFIVMFCHVIETQDEADLAHLQAFITSIQSAPSISGPAFKLHRLFQVLCKIATGYVRFRVSTTLEDGWQDSSTIDHCLDALGFSFTSGHIPTQQRQSDTPHICTESDFGADDTRNSADAMNNRIRATDPMIWMANSAELEDWLETELSTFLK